MTIAIVDTGCANIASVRFALGRLGVDPVVTRDAETIRGADTVFLPGVGAAPYAMAQLSETGLPDTLRTLTQPVMGVCLGMQIMFDHLAEGDTPGLGLIPGTVEPLETHDLPSPHMGWNRLERRNTSPLLSGVNGEHVYFVHSFAVPVTDATLATATYGSPFSAVVQRDNFYGCQFHPERSSAAGSRILQNFLDLP